MVPVHKKSYPENHDDVDYSGPPGGISQRLTHQLQRALDRLGAAVGEERAVQTLTSVQSFSASRP